VRAIRAILTLLTFLNFLTAARAQSVLRNGGFESGFSGWNGTFGIYTASSNPYQGQNVGVLMHESNSSVGMTLQQTFPTTPGYIYNIHFAIRLPELVDGAPVSGDSRGGSTSVGLQWNGRSLGAVGVNLREWRTYTFSAVADSPLTTLGFAPFSNAAEPFLDGVSVVAVPEPRSGILGLAGALLLQQFRSRRAQVHKST
jgi:hypothetical protein